MVAAAAEAIWLRQLMEDLSLGDNDPTVILCDNQSALALVDTTKFHNRTKHIAVRYNFIKQLALDKKGGSRESDYREDHLRKTVTGRINAGGQPLEDEVSYEEEHEPDGAEATDGVVMGSRQTDVLSGGSRWSQRQRTAECS
ncbi:hypothetical protein R1sor_002924 [Riccia sorocarpa]|uniref:Retrovirus-related Pol polyprotein from transposon TNT 1-94 n=1 Tax=Riccia sorocarpa TaxID=122646 RepID=A0ABD3H066_9MARC